MIPKNDGMNYWLIRRYTKDASTIFLPNFRRKTQNEGRRFDGIPKRRPLI